MRAIGTWQGGYRSLLEDGRGHEVAIDLSAEEGGADGGTSALELSVLSLAGCITTIFALVAEKRRVGFDALSVELDAERPRGSPTITSVSGSLRVVTSAPPEEVATVLNLTLRTCPVGVLFEHAQIPIRVRPIVAAPRPTSASPGPSKPAATDSVNRSHAHPPTHDHGHLAKRAWTREEAIQALDAPGRRETQDPEALWTRVGLESGATVVDVGAGTAFFAIPAARRVGPQGRVYAVEVSEELIDLLRERRGTEDLPQLLPIQSTLSTIPLESGIADVVLLANVLHDIPPSTLSEAVRLLKPHGRLVNVDWKKLESPGGPPFEIRLSLPEAEELLGRHGLATIDRWDFGPWHYGLILRPSRSSVGRDGRSDR